MMSDSVNF